MAKRKLPKEVLLYVCDTDNDGEDIYAVALTLDDIPETEDGDVIGIYYLNKSHTFIVRRELK